MTKPRSLSQHLQSIKDRLETCQERLNYNSMRCQHHSMTSPDQSKTIIRVIISLSNVKINFYRYLLQQRYFFRVYMTLFNNLKSKSCWIDLMFFLKMLHMFNKFCFNHEYLKKKSITILNSCFDVILVKLT